LATDEKQSDQDRRLTGGGFLAVALLAGVSYWLFYGQENPQRPASLAEANQTHASTSAPGKPGPAPPPSTPLPTTTVGLKHPNPGHRTQTFAL